MMITPTMAAAFGALIAVLTVVWAASIKPRDVSIVDLWWGLGFVIAAWFYCVHLDAFEPTVR